MSKSKDNVMSDEKGLELPNDHQCDTKGKDKTPKSSKLRPESLLKKVATLAGDGELQSKLKKWKESADKSKPVFSFDQDEESGDEDEGSRGPTVKASNQRRRSSVDPRPVLPPKSAKFRYSMTEPRLNQGFMKSFADKNNFKTWLVENFNPRRVRSFLKKTSEDCWTWSRFR